MEPVYKETWYAPWHSAPLSRGLFVTCQPQHVPIVQTQPGQLLFLLNKGTNRHSTRLGTCQPGSAQGSLLPTWLITHAKIENELLILYFFFFSFYTCKGQEKITLFQMPVKFHFSGIKLGINLASCRQLFCPIPANSGPFPIHSKFLGCSSTFRGSLNVG